jgi:hypothetical protein
LHSANKKKRQRKEKTAAMAAGRAMLLRFAAQRAGALASICSGASASIAALPIAAAAVGVGAALPNAPAALVGQPPPQFASTSVRPFHNARTVSQLNTSSIEDVVREGAHACV